MSWLTLSRRPEPEVLPDAEEADAYASAVGRAFYRQPARLARVGDGLANGRVMG